MEDKKEKLQSTNINCEKPIYIGGKMKISGIDKDFVDIIDYLNNKGFYTYASCDGVLEHHENKNKPIKAYIAFLKSDKIVDVMAVFLRDKSNFSVSLSNSTHTCPYELYGNIIKGNTYQVNFYNLQGQLTEYFKKIVIGTVDEKISISDEEIEKLIKLDECLEKTEDSEISFTVELNREYQPFTNKSGKTNCLIIRTKEGLGYNKNMQELAQIISEKFGISLKKDEYGENFENVDEFMVPQFDRCSLEYCFKDEDLSKVIDIIELTRIKEKSLEYMDINKQDYDDYSIE